MYYSHWLTDSLHVLLTLTHWAHYMYYSHWLTEFTTCTTHTDSLKFTTCTTHTDSLNSLHVLLTLIHWTHYMYYSHWLIVQWYPYTYISLNGPKFGKFEKWWTSFIKTNPHTNNGLKMKQYLDQKINDVEGNNIFIIIRPKSSRY